MAQDKLTLRRTVQVRLGFKALRLPGGTLIFTVSQHQFMNYPGWKTEMQRCVFCANPFSLDKNTSGAYKSGRWKALRSDTVISSTYKVPTEHHSRCTILYPYTIKIVLKNAEVAQSVEQWTENPRVPSSILGLGTTSYPPASGTWLIKPSPFFL